MNAKKAIEQEEFIWRIQFSKRQVYNWELGVWADPEGLAPRKQ